MKVPGYISKAFPISPLEKLALDRRFPVDGLEELVVTAQTLGNMLISFDANTEARVMAVAEPHLLPQRVERDGERLIIEMTNFKKFLQQGQAEQMRYEVHVPAHLRLKVNFGAGALILMGGEGLVDISAAVGQISGYTHSRAIDLRLNAGEVRLDNLHGQAAIKVNVGKLSLNWSELSGDEQVIAKCDVGSVDLQVPPAVAVREVKGGLFLRKTVDIPFSTQIQAEVGLGGLDVIASKPFSKPVVKFS